MASFPTEEDPIRREEMRRRIAAAIGDEAALERILGTVPAEFDDFYGDSAAPSLSTEDTIDAFLDRFAPPAGLAADPLAVAPAVDYATMLEIENRAETGHPVDENTVAKAENSKMSEAERAVMAAEEGLPTPPDSDTTASKMPEDTSLSESFARILIKNRKYSKALEIISQLSLNNPEKSVYFADQIRFLRKVVYNENKSKK